MPSEALQKEIDRHKRNQRIRQKRTTTKKKTTGKAKPKRTTDITPQHVIDWLGKARYQRLAAQPGTTANGGIDQVMATAIQRAKDTFTTAPKRAIASAAIQVITAAGSRVTTRDEERYATAERHKNQFG